MIDIIVASFIKLALWKLCAVWCLMFCLKLMKIISRELNVVCYRSKMVNCLRSSCHHVPPVTQCSQVMHQLLLEHLWGQVHRGQDHRVVVVVVADPVEDPALRCSRTTTVELVVVGCDQKNQRQWGHHRIVLGTDSGCRLRNRCHSRSGICLATIVIGQNMSDKLYSYLSV